MTNARRALREKKTIAAMIGMYCSAHHGSFAPCDECSGLLSYACRKIDTCVLHDGKTTCNTCSVHCYSGVMRESVRKVMRFSGPRMLAVHPLLSVLHLLDRFRRPGASRT